MNLLSDTKISWLQKDTLISGMNYDETFVHVTKITIICTLIALALVHQWHISQLDVKSIFLNEDFQEKIYMAPPLGVSHDFGYVCKLKKALYNLKQALHAWFKKFFVVISFFKFISNSYDSTLFIKYINASLNSSKVLYWYPLINRSMGSSLLSRPVLLTQMFTSP